MAWTWKNPLSILPLGDSKQSGIQKIVAEITEMYSVLNDRMGVAGHTHDGTDENGPKLGVDSLNGVASTDGLLESTGYGIIGDGLQVLAQATPNMTIQASAGIIHMPDGKRHVISQMLSMSIAAADATNPRIDLIYVDPALGGISCLTGTPATSPVAPTLPGGGLELANISVAAGATSITSANITDLRGYKSRYQNLNIINVKDFGAKGDGITNDTVAVQNAIAFANGREVRFPSGRYMVNIKTTYPFNIVGAGCHTTFFQAFDTSKPIFINKHIDSHWSYSKVSEIYFDGVGVLSGSVYVPISGTIGFSFGDPSIYAADDENIGRVIFTNCRFVYLDVGIFRCWGNIGNVYNNCVFSLNNYGYYSRDPRLVNVTYGLMNAGCELFNGGEFNHNNIAGLCALDGASAGHGQWTFHNTIVQFNIGFGLYFSFLSSNASPVIFDNVWDEGNGGGNVTIHAVDPSNSLIKEVSLLAVGKYVNLSNYIELCDEHINYGSHSNYASSTVYADSRPNYAAARARTDDASYAFVTPGYENTPDALLKCDNAGTIYAACGRTTTGRPIGLYPNGTVGIGYQGQAGGQPFFHVIAGADTVAKAVGDKIAEIRGNFNSGYSVEFFNSDGSAANASATVITISKNTGTSRSINCSGTVNTSGSDYAEYMFKADDCGRIEKGNICGIDANGKLTDKFANAISFVVKSTNPSYVGGDTWGSESIAGKKPVLTEQKAAVHGDNDVLITPAETDAEYAARKVTYEAELAIWKEKLEAERQKVDRIAFSGQVPVNVVGAAPGQYIIPVDDGTDIKGQAVTSPTFEQYQIAVGKVIGIEYDGRARIIVKVA